MGARAAALRSRGQGRQREGQFDAAIELFRQSVETAPTEAEGYIELAGCLLTARRPEAALEVCAVGLRHAGETAALFCAQAAVLQSLSRVGEAAAAYRAALAADPTSAQARHGLALQAAEMGDWDEAETLIAPLAPPTPGRDWLAARIALGRGDFETALARLARAEDGLARSDQQAEAALLRGEALDGLGRHAEAFAAFSRGKAQLRAFYAERAADRESETDKLTRLAAWFEAADPAPWRATAAGADPGVRGHAFLLGFPRSGTTLLEQALAGHPDLVALEEAPTLAEAYDAFLADTAGLERLAHLSAADAEHWRGVYWRAVAAHGADPRGRVFLDKAPAGTLYLPLIAGLFPEAKLLFAVRDPRDVVLSCFRSSFQMNALTYAFTDLTETARCYAACMRLAGVYRRVLPISLVDVRYERFVDDFEGELQRIVAHLGLDLAPGMTDVAGTASRRIVRTPSAPQVRAGLNRQGLGRWRAYADELAPALPILQPWIDRLSYGAAG